jgi:hypothetical protein
MGSFWFAAGPLRIKRLALCGKAQQAAYTGLETFTLAPTDHRLRDTALLEKGRALLMGAACRRTYNDGTTKYKGLPSHKIWALLRLVPSEIELLIRRLKWCKRMARDPDNHVNLMAALLGRFLFKDGYTVDDTLALQVDPDSNVQGRPWATRLYHDAQRMKAVDEAQDFVEHVGLAVCTLFTCHAADEFARVDVTQLRAIFWSSSVPPPGLTAQTQMCATESQAVDAPHQCLVPGCDRNVASRRALFAHLRAATSTGHGTRALSHLLVVTKQCFWCRSNHLTRDTTPC